MKTPDIGATGQCAVGCRTEAARRDDVREVCGNLEQFGIAIQSLEEIHGVVAGVPNPRHSIGCHLVLNAQGIGFSQWLAKVGAYKTLRGRSRTAASRDELTQTCVDRGKGGSPSRQAV